MELGRAQTGWREWTAARLTARPEELSAVAYGFLLFFMLFCAYMMLRPVRETMGITGGVDNLQWLFLATFLATLIFIPLFGLLASKLPRARLLPASYVFAAATLTVLGTMMIVDPADVWLGRVFYVWLSVLNLFLISVAWSLMSDVFRSEQATRLFGSIAAGASAGALVGPIASGSLVAIVGHGGLLLLSAMLLLLTIPLANQLVRWRDTDPRTEDRSWNVGEALGGGVLSGLMLILRSPYLLGIGLMVVLLASVSTFLYFEQARIVAAAIPDPVRQTQIFSAIDVLVQALTIAVQLLVTGRIAQRMGITPLLTAIPLLMVGALGLLALAASFPLLIGIVVLRRVGEYALARPGREMLFTKVGQEARYKAKNVIDTVVYRGGDAISAWIKTAVDAVGAPAMLVGAGFAGAWALTGFWLGRAYDQDSEPTLDGSLRNAV